jgi:hypothetical protein
LNRPPCNVPAGARTGRKPTFPATHGTRPVSTESFIGLELGYQSAAASGGTLFRVCGDTATPTGFPHVLFITQLVRQRGRTEAASAGPRRARQTVGSETAKSRAKAATVSRPRSAAVSRRCLRLSLGRAAVMLRQNLSRLRRAQRSALLAGRAPSRLSRQRLRRSFAAADRMPR